MGDIGDMWRDFKPEQKRLRREEKQDRKKVSLEILKQWGITPRWPSSTHCIIEAFGHRWDFWPTTGKWMRFVRGGARNTKRGVELLIADIESHRTQQ